MTARNLDAFLRPRSVAVIAEPDEPTHYADVVARNLAAGGFAGPLIFTSAKKRSRFTVGSRVRLGKLAEVPDLAIVCAALGRVPQIISQLGALGTRAVIVGPSVRDRMSESQSRAAFKAILEAARPKLIRVLGPGSGGVLVPALGLNASVAPISAIAGRIALVTQSASVASAVLDRAYSKGIGFSSVVHLGASLDVDLADVLDYLAADPDTGSILVQFDALTSGRKFMSAARAAARNKPVVALRAGRDGSAASRAFSSDELFEAALRRAGWVIIDTLGDLFEAAEAMARVRAMHGERLSILGNGYGLARIAGDALLHSGGQLATLTDDTVGQLNTLLGARSPRCNPLALPANVTPQTWAGALTALLGDGGTDAVLTICSPSPFAPSTEVASALCAVIAGSARNVFTCWVGGSTMLEAQRIAAAHDVVSHDSPEKAIAVFLGIVNYLRNRQLLMQMPPSLAEDFLPDGAAARSALDQAAGADRLPAPAARSLLQAYGIDAAEYPLAASIDAAIESADAIGYPVDLTLSLANAPNFAPDFAPAARALRSSADIHIAARGLRRSAHAEHPEKRVTGYRLRPSAPRSGAPALRLGVLEDPLFGPVIFLGPSAMAAARECRFVLALPPLNLALANDLIARSRFSQEAPESQRAALELAASKALVRLSQLLTDLDEVTGIEIDPLHVEVSGVLALDSQIRIEPRGRKLGHRRFAICPYPNELEQRLDWHGRALLIRPIRPEDETALGDLLNSLAPEDARMRFFDTMRRLPRSQLARFTQIDYDREMALVAIERDDDGTERSLGEVRAVADPDHTFADFAIVVRSELKGRGLGRLLLRSIIDYARRRGIGELRGDTLSGNLRMQQLAQNLGFELKAGAERGTVDMRLVLREP